MRNITANDNELQALAVLLDAAVKHSGLQAVDAAAVWKRKIETAEEVAEEETPELTAVESDAGNWSG